MGKREIPYGKSKKTSVVKIVTQMGTRSAHIYVPREWIGHKVVVALVTNGKQDVVSRDNKNATTLRAKKTTKSKPR